MVVIYTDDLSVSTYITNGIVQEAIDKLPKFILNMLTEFHLKIYITDVFKATGIHGLGCYYFEELKYGKEQAVFLIDKKTYFNAKYVFYHEVGHFLDDILGCYKGNVPFTKDNCAIYRFSKNDEYFQRCNLIENDFFTQISRNTKDAIFYDDMRESFADCFAEVMLNKKNLKMRGTKNTIISELQETFSQIYDKAS